MVTKTSKSVKEYFEKMQQEVILHWKNLDNADSIAESEFLTYYEIGKAKSWLENISYLGNSKDSLPWEEFESRLPENLSNSEKRKQLFAEFNYLFPQSKRTEAFFPLLLTSFSLNSSRNKPFVRDLFTTKLPIDIEASVNELTSIPKWEKTYERLIKNKKARKVSTKNLARALAVYRRIMVFFLFIKASSKITNIPLSFYAFEAMSGYISLLDNEAQEKKTVIPVVVALFLFSMFSRIFVENGAPDYFLIWLACGVPFGIGKMFTLIPIGFGISGTVGVVALNLVLGGLIGGVILIWKLAVALWYLPLTIYRLVT